MIRAVFFDFYGTLANWAPSAESIQQAAAAVDGITLDQPAITQAYFTANAYMDAENALQPIRQRPREEVAAFFAEYERRLLTAAGAVDVSLDTAERVWQRVSATPKTMALYPDAQDVLTELSAEGLRLGVVSNIGPELDNWLDRLGVADLLPVRATSTNTGANKPWPLIFEKALEWAGVSASEAVHVGDSVESDVRGALGAGIAPVLVHRDGALPDIAGVRAVRSLSEAVAAVRAIAADATQA